MNGEEFTMDLPKCVIGGSVNVGAKIVTFDFDDLDATVFEPSSPEDSNCSG